ncbi:transposase [Sellimonas intestinalis]|uniref:transposase n=1 Tax=Sellimonas intestinalis TaxID=1653434 RepID=UPI003992F21F
MDCSGCPYKEKCTESEGKQAAVSCSKSFLRSVRSPYQNILSEKGIKYRMNRSIQVEGAFGVLKNDYGFQRFLLQR